MNTPRCSDRLAPLVRVTNITNPCPYWHLAIERMSAQRLLPIPLEKRYVYSRASRNKWDTFGTDGSRQQTHNTVSETRVLGPIWSSAAYPFRCRVRDRDGRHAAKHGRF